MIPWEQITTFYHNSEDLVHSCRKSHMNMGEWRIGKEGREEKQPKHYCVSENWEFCLLSFQSVCSCLRK